MNSSSENRKSGGKRGAKFGLSLEKEFAQRTNGRVLKNVKTDVIDSNNDGHSIKNSRKSNPRWLAKSYSCINETDEHFSIFLPYIEARKNNDKKKEEQACITIANQMNNPEFSKVLLKTVMTGNEHNLKYLTCYDNRTEIKPEDYTGNYRSFNFSNIIDYYIKNFKWKAVFGKKHWNIVAKLPNFNKKAMSICLGSQKRKLLLFNFDNIQSQLDYFEKCKMNVINNYKCVTKNVLFEANIQGIYHDL